MYLNVTLCDLLLPFPVFYSICWLSDWRSGYRSRLLPLRSGV